MYIKLNDNGIVDQVITDIAGDQIDLSLLVGFIEVDTTEEDVNLKSYDSTTNSFSESAESIRAKRNMILFTEVDPIVSNALRWADMTTQEQNAWSQYRTDLLNITDQTGFPTNVTWPSKPQ